MWVKGSGVLVACGAGGEVVVMEMAATGARCGRAVQQATIRT